MSGDAKLMINLLAVCTYSRRSQLVLGKCSRGLVSRFKKFVEGVVKVMLEYMVTASRFRVDVDHGSMFIPCIQPK